MCVSVCVCALQIKTKQKKLRQISLGKVIDPLTFFLTFCLLYWQISRWLFWRRTRLTGTLAAVWKPRETGFNRHISEVKSGCNPFSNCEQKSKQVPKNCLASKATLVPSHLTELNVFKNMTSGTFTVNFLGSLSFIIQFWNGVNPVH